jgi:hypothetical protein
MLDPKEIRAGNWVLKITGTDTNTHSFFEYKAIKPDEYDHTFAMACFPIPLTPDILGKSGLRHAFGDWFINREAEGIDEGLPFLRYKQKDKCWYLEGRKLWTPPAYLHQLQNLYYALTNKEMVIQLGFFENISMIGPINFFVKPLNKYSLVREIL